MTSFEMYGNLSCRNSLLFVIFSGTRPYAQLWLLKLVEDELDRKEAGAPEFLAYAH